MLLEPRQRQKLAELARLQGKSVAEITRQAIDAGLERMSVDDQRDRRLSALAAAKRLRESMPVLNTDLVKELQQMREERGDALLRGN
jgi:hypothetical protein